MPRGDGTGPMGIGPMTGRGVGYCLGNIMPGNGGIGTGFCRGTGGGRGFGRMFYLTGRPVWARGGNIPAMPGGQVFDEKAALKNQEESLEKQLKQVKDRMKEFDTE